MWVNQLIAIMQIHRDRLLRITLIERKTCNDFLNFSGPREKYLTRMTRQLKKKKKIKTITIARKCSFRILQLQFWGGKFNKLSYFYCSTRVEFCCSIVPSLTV